MKPRNKYEKHIAELSAKLPDLTKAQKDYAFEHCFSHMVVKRCDRFHCCDCGTEWVTPDMKAEPNMVCPYCGHLLTLEVTRKQSWFERSSFQIVTTAAECQVVRTFYTRKYFTVGKPAKYWIDEAVQIFITPGRKDDLILARPISYNGCYCDNYSFQKEISIKCTVGRMNRNYSYNIRPYLTTGDVVYPRRRVLPELKRNGYGKIIYKFPTYNTIRALLHNPQVETIVKAARVDILRGLDEDDIKTYWPQVKMLIRHNYTPNDYKIWRDTLKLAEDLKLDTHSPKYVLPDNLTAMHDLLSRRYTAYLERERKERTTNSNGWYRKTHGKLLMVVVEENGMHIAPLQTKEEFIEEGREMNHCVASYFDRKGCLILSVRSDNGKRLATVELSEKDFTITQCRANSNKQPERFQEICDIINNHRMDFVKASKRK